MNRWIFQCRWLSTGITFINTSPTMLLKHLTGFEHSWLLHICLIFYILINTFIKHSRRWSERSISDIRYVPDVYTTFLQLFVCMAIHDTIFYHAHRSVISYYYFIKCLLAYKTNTILWIFLIIKSLHFIGCYIINPSTNIFIKSIMNGRPQ